jgi:hypothetical protein
MVLDTAQRDDLLVPHDLIRDEYGVVVACRAFARRSLMCDTTRPTQVSP